MCKKANFGLALLIVVLVLSSALGVSAAPAAQEELTYTVKLGDNLWTLAEKYLGSGPAYWAIVGATSAKRVEDSSFADIVNPNLIHPGWKLMIPSAEQVAELMTPTSGLGTADNPIVIAFVPSAEAERVITGAEGFTNLLSEKTGYVFEGLVPTSYAAAIEAMCAGKAHMGTLATFSYILANEKCGVSCALVSVRYGSPYYTGQIIAGADTGIASIPDLAGKTMCWVDAASTSGYIIPRIMLKAEGVEPDTDLAEQIEAGSHDSVALAVYQGDCHAGATYVDARDAIEDEYPDVKDKTVVIAESPEIPNDGLQFAADFPPVLRARIVAAILEIMATEEGIEAMGTAYGWDAVMAKDDTFYDDFRAVLDASGVDVTELAD